MFDHLPDINPNEKPSPRIIPLDNAPASPGERKFAEELRSKADRELLASAGAESPLYAAATSFANTALANIPRNVAAGVRTFKTGKPFAEEYKFLQDVDAAAARQSPWISDGAAMGGALGQAALLPVAPAASMLGRAGQSAAIGGLTAGAAEFMDTGDPLKADMAALGGAALGGLASPAVEGIARGLGAAVTGPAAMVRGLINPEAEAARRVQGAIAQDTRVGGNKMKPGDFDSAQILGQPAVVADVGGETTKALARSAANTSPEARQALLKVTNDRFEGQAPRISEYVMGMGTGQNAIATREQLQAAAKRVNRPAYEKAYAEAPGGVWNDQLAQLAQAPDMAAAIKAATKTGANKAAAEGFRPVKNPFTVDASGNVTLTDPKVTPSLQFWDHVKQNLDDTIERYSRAGEKGARNDAIELKRQLVAYLDSIAPSYKEARQGAAKFFGAEDAIEAGEIFASPKARGSNAEYARIIAKFSPPEKQLFADGFISKLSDQIRETGDRRNVINTIFNSPAAKERVAMALGPARAKSLEAFLHTERIMDELRTAVQGNSTTARQLAEAGLAGGAVGGFLGGSDPRDISLGALMGAMARTGKTRIDARVAQRVGEMLASNNPDVVKKAIGIAAKNRPILDFLRNLSLTATGTESGLASEKYTGR